MSFPQTARNWARATASLISATIASVFPKWAAATSFATVFYILAGFTVVYLVTVTFFLPETKGRTLEEIEQYFKTGSMPEKA